MPAWIETLWQPTWLSLRIALFATVLAGVVAVPLANVMARRRFVGRSLLEAIITVPVVLPPTIVGYLIIMGLGAHSWIGRWLAYSVVFRFEGAVLAAAIVAVPMFYLPAKAGFGAIDPDLEDMARSLGSGPFRVFFRITLPLAMRGLMSGCVLAFARALGEFGATLMVFGWQEERLTLPILIYSEYEQGKPANATPAAVVLIVMSLSIIAIYNRIAPWPQGRRG